ncbi:MAG: hypothetical protein HOI95_02115 [Chromatiales bacterium]|nr:hypothetical protein [Chromatiales bacterium]
MVALDEAEEIAASADLHAHDAETQRRRGELYQALDQSSEAEAAWRSAAMCPGAAISIRKCARP